MRLFSKVLVVVLVAVVVAVGLAGCSSGNGHGPTDQDPIDYSPQGYEAHFTLGNLHDIDIVIGLMKQDVTASRRSD